MKKPLNSFRRVRDKSPAPRVIAGPRQYIKLVAAGVYESDVTGLTLLQANYNHMEDYVTPGFAQRRAQLGYVNNPLTQSIMTLRGGSSVPIHGFYAPGTSGHREGHMDESYRSLGCLIGVNAPLRISSSLNAMVGRVQMRALAGVEAPELNTIEALGEFRQTMGLLVSPLRGLAKWLANAEKTYERDLARYGRAQARANRARSSKERARRRAQIAARGKGKTRELMERMRTFGESLADGVLSTNLGWKPFLMDIDSLLNRIPSLENLQGSIRTSRANETMTDKYTVTTVHPATWMAQATTQTSYDDKIVVRAKVAYRGSFEVSQHFGVRLQDVPEGMWNLLPLSWLVDYFVNVNDFLGALRARAYAEVVEYSTTTLITSEAQRSCIAVTPTTTAGYTWSFTGGPVGASDSASFLLKTRWADSFDLSLGFQKSILEQAPSHIQNTLSILLNRLLGIRKNFT